MVIIPLVLLLNIFIIYMQFRRLPLTLIVFAGIPVAFGGGMIACGIADLQLNTAVWVGFIALFGIAIDDGVVIATYLDQTLKNRLLRSPSDIRDAVVEAGLKRIRPCLMTTFTTVIALVPVLWATGRGADVARAMAIPVFGGMLIELVTLFVVPVVYCGFLEMKMKGGLRDNRFSIVAPDEETVAA
jgi:Cu(I)/Ag(I) efflux system membrane protein CusA/SilA